MIELVRLEHISKRFPGVVALQEVDLHLQAGTIHALVGENGAGKSTLINILSGVLRPDHGEVHVAGQPAHFADARSARKHGIVTVHQELDLFPDLTLVENIGLEQGLPTNRWGWIDWRRQRERTSQALAAVGEPMSLQRRAGTLSAAQRQMVEIAAAVTPDQGTHTRVLILDEPTSSLSDAEAHILFQHLRRFRDAGSAILYVSHRLEEIFALANEVTVLRDGRRVWTGPITDCSESKLIEWMVGREMKPIVSKDRPRESKSNAVPGIGPICFRSNGLTAADGSFVDIQLEARGGEILGLYGLIGAGRSEWAQAVFGLLPIARGTIELNGQVLKPDSPAAMIEHGFALVPEDRLHQGLCRGLSIRANVVLATLRRLAKTLWISQSAEVTRTRAAIDRLGIRAHATEQIAGTLSGGNQQKVIVGRWLECNPRVFFLDEPTRGVDVGAKAEIHGVVRRLADEGRAIILISSDLPEVMSQSDRIGVMCEGKLKAVVDPRCTSAEEIAQLALPASQNAGDQEDFAAGTVTAVPLANRSWRIFIPEAMRREAALFLVVVSFFGFLQIWTGQFLVADNLREIATNAALLGFVALAVTLVILAGALDISLGALMALSAAVAGKLWEQDYPLWLVVAVAMLVGGIGGAINAALSLLGRVHPIVVTLGTMSVYRGLTLWWLKQDIQIRGAQRNWIFAEALGLPVILWLGLALVLLVWIFLTQMISGRELYALGSNPAAAHRVGIDRSRVWFKAFTLQGVLVGLAGWLYLARSGNLQPTSFEGMTLEAIAAAVVGGIAITGGRGSVAGVVLGCIFLKSLAPASTMLHVPTVWEQMLVGSVMAVAVLIDAFGRRKS